MSEADWDALLAVADELPRDIEILVDHSQPTDREVIIGASIAGFVAFLICLMVIL